MLRASSVNCNSKGERPCAKSPKAASGAGLRRKSGNPISIIELSLGGDTHMEEQPQYKTIKKFDRQYGSLLEGNSLHTKPATIKEVDFYGESETFVVQTIRAETRRKVKV